MLCRCCPQGFTILVGRTLLCVSPHPGLPQGVSATVGVEPPSPGVPTTPAVAANFDDEVAELEAGWFMKNASTSRAFAASEIASAENTKSVSSAA
jgi:hypothetical protein